MKVRLLPAESRLVEWMARQVAARIEKEGWNQPTVGQGSWLDYARQGFGAEIAFCKLFNVYPDLSIDGPARAGCDITLHDGRTIEIKSIDAPWKNLIAPLNTADKPRPDYFGLMVCNSPYYEWMGAIPADEFLVPGRLKNLGRGLTYVASPNELRPLRLNGSAP